MPVELKDVLPDYGDRDFLLGLLQTYVLDHVTDSMDKDEDGSREWNIGHVEYANSVLKKLGGTGVDDAITSARKYLNYTIE